MTEEQLTFLFYKYSIPLQHHAHLYMNLECFKDAIAEYEAEKEKDTCRTTLSSVKITEYYSDEVIIEEKIYAYTECGFSYDHINDIIKKCAICGKRIDVVE